MSPPNAPDTGLYRWRFGDAEFDEARHELRVGGLPVEVEHKPLRVLALLLRHTGEVVTKEELFAEVWAGRVTVDHVLATAIGKLRKALGGAGGDRIVTVPRIGYRLTGQVERIATGRRVYLQQGASQELKRLLPSFSYDRWPTDHVRLEYTGKGLEIRQLPDGELYLQAEGDPKQLGEFQGLKAARRGQYDQPYQLHIGSPGETHVVWQFRW